VRTSRTGGSGHHECRLATSSRRARGGQLVVAARGVALAVLLVESRARAFSNALTEEIRARSSSR